MEENIEQRLNIALKAAEDAGKILIEIQKKDFFQIDKKGITDLVTEADRASEKLIRNLILQNFPNDSILGEEEGARDGSSDYKWIIDPLDGTTNFSHRLPLFAISIGIENKLTKEVLIGVVATPALGDTYYAMKGSGAFKNKNRISVSKTTNLIDALFCTGFPYSRDKETERIITYFRNILLKTQGVRRTGAAALDLAWVAEGRFDGFWEERLSPWDMAAGGIIIQEAGGKVTTYNGNIFHPYIPNILATNGSLHDLAKQELTNLNQNTIEGL